MGRGGKVGRDKGTGRGGVVKTGQITTTKRRTTDMDFGQDQGEDAQATNRVRLHRRDTDDQVERIMKGNVFPHFTRERAESVVDSDGVTPAEAIAEDVRRLRGSKAKMRPPFWDAWRQRFGLTLSTEIVLPDPVVDDNSAKVAEDLVDSVALMHCPNPAARRSDA